VQNIGHENKVLDSKRFFAISIMFKRILSALSGKKVDNAPQAPEPAIVDQAQTANAELITVYDAYGREVKIERGEWRNKVFLPNLEQNWNKPAELYSQILSGLNNGFAADLIPAAARLVEIDDIHERCHVIQGIVLLKNGQLDAAEATLRAGMEKAGATGTLLTNLAKVFAERGNQASAEETLREALRADPNQENGLLWWLAIERDRGGEAAYLQALRTVADMPGSWRAQLWLARHHLQNNEVGEARALYVEVLAGGMFDGTSLMMISGDLGNSGQIPMIVELIAPIYDEHRHDPTTGMNLLRAYQALGKVDEGEALLARMYALGLAPYKQHLDQFSHAFQEMRRQAAQAIPVDPDDHNFSTIGLSAPIWHYGLRNADWLFAQKPEGAQEVGFFSLSLIVESPGRAESQREDDVGRLSRAIPLYLAEAAHYWTDYESGCYFQIVEGGGPVVTGTETDGDALFDLVPPTMRYFVTGQIGCDGEEDQADCQISLNLWDCATRTKNLIWSGKAVRAQLGAMVLSVEESLLGRIGMRRTQGLDAFYQHPTAEVMPVYLAELGQAFMLTLLGNGHMPKTSVWGERAMLDWPLTMALSWPTVEIPKLMYLSGLGKASDYGSDVLPEYKERTLALLREAEEAGSPAARLAPLVWKLFGMHEKLEAHIQGLPADTSPEYMAWVGRVRE
jgi:tetratricopeptide (TPR) repeat protein